MPRDTGEGPPAFGREDLIRALRARERFLTGIIGSLESFITVDAHWRITFVNAAAVELFEMSADELVGRDIREMVPDDVLEQSRGAAERAMNLNVAAEFDATDRQHGRTYRGTAHPLADGGFALYIRDATERARSEQARLDLERRYRDLVEGVNSAILRWDDRGMVTFVNDYAERLFGWSAEELVGRPVTLLVPPSKPGARDLSALDQEILADPERFVTNVNENVCKDGQRLWVAWTNRVLRDDQGVVREVLAIGNDVTELVRTQAALREREAEAAAAHERGRIASDLHDSVTQALFAASLKAEALGSSPELVLPAAAGDVEEVRRLSRGALAQMRIMLLELRGDPIEGVPIHQLLRNLVEATESRASVKVTLTIDGQVILPKDVHRAVYRITQEALNNVVRHATAAHAWVELRAEPPRVRLVVGDDGRGFEPGTAALGHVGLASMNERAAQSGGALSLVSSEGTGTVVTVDWTLD